MDWEPEICKDCAEAADHPGRIFCRCCGRRVNVYRTGVAYSKLSAVVHKIAGMRCLGSKKPPITGHDKCRGCDCQHG